MAGRHLRVSRTGREVAALSALSQPPIRAAVLTGLPLVNRELADRFLPRVRRRVWRSAALIVVVLARRRSATGGSRCCRSRRRRSAWSGRPACWRSAASTLDLFAIFAVVTFVGIGVDYGVHLVHRYHEHGDAPRAIDELAPVILVAAAITLLGYGTLVTSSYPPLRSIGVVSAVERRHACRRIGLRPAGDCSPGRLPRRRAP